MYPRYFFPPHNELCFDLPVQQSAPGLHHSSVTSVSAASGTWVPSIAPGPVCAQQDTQMLAPAVPSSQRNFSTCKEIAKPEKEQHRGCPLSVPTTCASSPASGSQVCPLGALLSADVADVPHAQPVHVLGTPGCGQWKVDLGSLLETGSPLAPSEHRWLETLETCSPRAWAHFAENVTLLQRGIVKSDKGPKSMLVFFRDKVISQKRDWKQCPG